MFRLIKVLILVIFANLSFAQNASSISFVIKNLGVNVDGHFNTFEIDANFDNNSELTELTGKITVSSIETGIDSRDEHLLEEDYFDTENHKYITLKSKTITKTSNGNYTVNASLSIKGKTKSITIPVTVSNTGNSKKIVSSFEINRKDFKVGGGSFVMSKTVKIEVIHFQEN
ncbi:YceI family protein [Winogradskyella tangerina]|uniref:YceI family protein n=1 Tax=Winogradskyella tangerina TaxID=2023240 RepID=UPI000DBE3C7D|nr:YceI family protein [Winogradskyella tangerina]